MSNPPIYLPPIESLAVIISITILAQQPFVSKGMTMNKFLITALFISPLAHADNVLNGDSRFIDIQLGATDMDTPTPNGSLTVSTISGGLAYTNMLMPISAQRNLYLGAKSSIQYHKGEETLSTGVVKVKQNFDTYSASIGPALYWAPTRRLMLYATAALSYNHIDLDASIETTLLLGKNTGSESGISPEFGLGARFAVNKRFYVGALYQVNNMSFDNDYDFTTFYTTLGYKF